VLVDALGATLGDDSLAEALAPGSGDGSTLAPGDPPVAPQAAATRATRATPTSSHWIRNATRSREGRHDRRPCADGTGRRRDPRTGSGRAGRGSKSERSLDQAPHGGSEGVPAGRRKETVPMDRDRIEAASRGDREAYADLVRTRGDRLYAIAQRILRDTTRAEDAVQDALVIAWRDLPSLRDPDRFDAWLYRLLVRSCVAEAQRQRRLTANLRVLPIELPEATDDYLSVADRDELDRGFRRLPPEQRAILVLRHYAGLEPSEIAEALGIPAGTARSRLHHAHRAMRAALEADARATATGGWSA
jgi:RNA polymerase sigma-70 factor (ECF subfamily)